jgi:hypothetical protein
MAPNFGGSEKWNNEWEMNRIIFKSPLHFWHRNPRYLAKIALQKNLEKSIVELTYIKISSFWIKKKYFVLLKVVYIA